MEQVDRKKRKRKELSSSLVSTSSPSISYFASLLASLTTRKIQFSKIAHQICSTIEMQWGRRSSLVIDMLRMSLEGDFSGSSELLAYDQLEALNLVLYQRMEIKCDIQHAIDLLSELNFEAHHNLRAQLKPSVKSIIAMLFYTLDLLSLKVGIFYETTRDEVHSKKYFLEGKSCSNLESLPNFQITFSCALGEKSGSIEPDPMRKVYGISELLSGVGFAGNRHLRRQNHRQSIATTSTEEVVMVVRRVVAGSPGNGASICSMTRQS
ncbi:hypothetical protein KSP39_PZI016370 [Platanthera zijinensis]|uniref:Uncharacterized protein n=1 Tax=Platanthera zijinensis TaxID=2320716 RepID=A0AAP0B6E6_9ASPA